MATAFDPYHKWLGIAPKDQPPNHYRLLGIDLLEGDPDVISLAADQRMAHVRTFQAGQNAALSQKLLNEIAAARVCLLNLEKKSVYDRTLRPRYVSASPSEARAAQTVAGPPQQTIPEYGSFADGIDTALSTRQSKRKRSQLKKASPFPVLGAAVGIAVIGIVALIVWKPTDSQKSASSSTVPSARPVEGTTPKNSQPVQAEPTTVSSNPRPKAGEQELIPADPIPSRPTDDDVPTTVAENHQAARSSSNLPDAPAVANDQPIQPLSTASITTDAAARRRMLEPAMAYPGTPTNRKPVPAAAAREQARRQIRELLQSEIKNAKNIDAKIALAEKLKLMAFESKLDETTEFVLLEEGANTSIHAGIMSECIDRLTERFDVDGFELKAVQLERIVKESAPANAAGVADCCLLNLSVALEANRLDIAPRFLAAARICATKTKNRKLGAQIAEQTKDVERLRKAWEQFRAAAEILTNRPDDPVANLTVGRYFATGRASWDRGLLFLACGSDDAFKSLAVRELAGPSKAAEQLQLANDWWDLAAGEKAPARSILQQHAADWYRTALPQLAALEKLRAEQRIAEASKSGGQSTQSQSPFAWLGKAIAESQIAQTEMLGSGSGQGFQDIVADGGFLVGFDLTTGKFGAGYRLTSITSLTPIYLTAKGAVRGRTCGRGDGPISIVAKDGYAVGKIAVLIDGRLQGLKITFMRIHGHSLNPKDAYDSEYVGGQERPDLPTIGGGRPIVGIAGQWEEHVRRLALIQVK